MAQKSGKTTSDKTVTKKTAAKPRPSATEGDDMEKAAGDGNVLEEMDELVLVGEVMVEEHRGRQGEHEHHTRHDASPVA